MQHKPKMKTIALALGASFAGSLAATGVAQADANPFGMTELSSGYMVAMAEGKCGEGKCGGDKAEGEGKCGGEGRCGAKAMDADADGNVSRDEFDAHHEKMFSKMDANSDGTLSMEEMHGGDKAGAEGKCGEGKCGGDKAGAAAKDAAEGKCGEGKCGGKK